MVIETQCKCHLKAQNVIIIMKSESYDHTTKNGMSEIILKVFNPRISSSWVWIAKQYWSAPKTGIVCCVQGHELTNDMIFTVSILFVVLWFFCQLAPCLYLKFALLWTPLLHTFETNHKIRHICNKADQRPLKIVLPPGRIWSSAKWVPTTFYKRALNMYK